MDTSRVDRKDTEPMKPWPTIENGVIFHIDREKSQISIKISYELFTDLEGYNNFFDRLKTGRPIVWEYAPKLIEVLKESDHYKKLKQEQQDANAISNGDKANKILAADDRRIDKEKLQILNTYYENTIKKRLGAINNTTISHNEKIKTIQITDWDRDLINRVFEKARWKIQRPASEENHNKKSKNLRQLAQNILSSLSSKWRRVRVIVQDRFLKHYTKTIGVIAIVVDWDPTKYIACQFVDKGTKLRWAMKGVIDFVLIDKEKIPDDVETITISHPWYIIRKLW